jgi:dolichol-phosphate mannosyltransferase
MISIIIPCFNEEQVIRETEKRLSSVMQSLEKDFELIFVNDGSKDSTEDILEEIALNKNYIKIINFSRNFGHQCAVSAGIHYCKGDYAVIIDADLQDPPEVIPGMLALCELEKCNVVYAQRSTRKETSIFKKITAKWYYRIINWLSDITFPVDTGDFRLIDRKVINEYNKLNEKNKYIRGLIVWMGFKQLPFLYDRKERFAGETKYTLSKMIRLAFAGIFGFSRKPLKLALNLGLFCIFMSVLLVSWIMYTYFFFPNKIIPGWTSTLITIVFLGGIQLLSIGVLGEYIGNIFDETKNRPEYIIESKINID